jgi:hypothetical protein
MPFHSDGNSAAAWAGRAEFPQWVSRYGSIAASSWDIATPDGMNEKGLVANMLWLVKSEYPSFDKDGGKTGLTIAAWAQYVLDNYATVKEAVESLRKEEFVVVTDFIPGTDKFTTVHLSISDVSGDSAILEYVEGKLVIHHDSSYQVMTNDPLFEEQLAIKGIGIIFPEPYFFQAVIALQIDLSGHPTISMQSLKRAILAFPWPVCSASFEMYRCPMAYPQKDSPIYQALAGGLWRIRNAWFTILRTF